MAGAILTQNTSWANVQKAINNLKDNKALKPRKLYSLSNARIANLIRPSGYYNIKAKRLKGFLDFFFKVYKGDVHKMCSVKVSILRKQLLSVSGIGPETADSILLYAIEKPVFVVDAYTKRILLRHRLIEEYYSYDQLQDLFMRNIRKDIKLFNEYHALLVRLGKEFCLKSKPKCDICPLKKV